MTALPPDLRQHQPREPNSLTLYNAGLALLSRKAKLEDLLGYTRWLAQIEYWPSGWLTDTQQQAELLYSDPEAWCGFDIQSLFEYTQFLQDEGYSLTSVNRVVSTFNHYIHLVTSDGVLPPYNPSELTNARPPRHSFTEQQTPRSKQLRQPKRSTPIELDADQVTRILKPSNTSSGVRDALLACLMAEQGLLISEIPSLMKEDLDLNQHRLRVYRGRGRKVETITLTHTTVEVLQAYLTFDPEPLGYLVKANRVNGTLKGLTTGRSGQRDSTSARPTGQIKDRSIFARIRVLGEKIGLPDLAPSDLRHYWLHKQRDPGPSSA